MPEALKKINGTVVAFGDVVQLSKERSKDPETDGFKRYVGLEHLDSCDLKVRSWGDIADGTTFTSVFRPGKVLFGKRRAYQRKVAVTDFSGVCSSDIYVLEPKGGHLLPELLPFICQSEPFYDYVISMSQGGLSPRVNWKALAKYEFAIPPLAEQRRIVEVLRTLNDTIEQLDSLGSATKTLITSALDHVFQPRKVADSDKFTCDTVRIDQLVDVIDPQPDHRTPPVVENGIPYVGVANVLDDDSIDFTNARKVGADVLKKQAGDFEIHPGAFIFGKIGTIGRIASVPTGRDFALSANVVLFSSTSRKSLDYVRYALASSLVRQEIARQVNRTSQPALGIKKIRALKIQKPDWGTTLGHLLLLGNLELVITNVEHRTAKSKEFRKLILRRSLPGNGTHPSSEILS